MENKLKTWQVNYIATYWVRADSEEQAIETGIAEHSKFPDGNWEAMIDYWDSENQEGSGK